MTFITNKAFWSWIFIFWTFALVIMSIIPNSVPHALQIGESSIVRTDYILHFISFLVLPIFYFLSGEKNILRKISLNIWLTLIAGVIFAILTETIQIYIPGRTFNILDMIWNIFGLLCGILAGKLLKKIINHKNQLESVGIN